METIAQFRDLWLILHLFAMVLGLGGATYSDILLGQFLKDLKISKKEASVIHTMSRVILVGIILAFISGVLLFLPEWEYYLALSKFQLKVAIFVVLMVNGFLLHHLVLPKLVHFSFHKDHLISETINLRHLGFTMGAISVVSWYSVFILGAIQSLPYSFWPLFGAYLLIVGVAISIALLIERKISQTLK